ncbi:helix-turn-helix domain-containing protein [Neobacillus cucumis]|uniref:IclR family transcriptional regulator domain-containing protein n=1 Tax=Neobacillus cucumis TaxID=1740721 RepID=UPI0020423C22|nr:IclR family transcriptional regulator C-terminal domain-containing protein [Neobacillus cucumis]MCM3729543.1 helix-turn-helix domain-containing protein [Neobacillus cucumis]
MKKAESNYFVNSVAKGFAVLTAFDSSNNTMSLSDLEKKTGINKATVRRFALTLVDLGYLTLTIDNKFKLRPKVLDLAAHYLESLNLPDLAHPILERISSTIKESTNVAIIDGAEIVYVLRVSAAIRIIGTNLRVGSRLPYYATSLGKALVAWLPAEERKKIWETAKVEAFTEHTITDFDKLEANFEDCRRNGYAEGNDELEVGLRSIAIPIFNKKGEPIAAINVSTNSMRTSEEKIKEVFFPLLKEGAEELNRLVNTFS